MFALLHAAIMDAQIACYEAKYFYWMLRPTQADPLVVLVLPEIPLPNHPSYPSGHSCHAAAAATVLGYFFPDRAAELENVVTQMGLSRLYAGIHYRFDITAGRDLGNAVGQWAIAVDESAGLLAAMR